MPYISIYRSEDITGLEPVVPPRSFIALKEADASSGLLLPELKRFLEDEGRRELGQLRGSAAEEVADFFDTLITTKLQDHPEYRRRMMRVLRSLSGSWGLLPASYTLQGEVEVSDSKEWIYAGYSEVWRGTLGCEKVAIKVIKITRTADREKLKKQLAKEAIIWKHLKHRNILPLYGVSTDIKLGGVDSDRICLVSPWMENDNIRNFVTQNPSFNRFKLLVDACEGLIYLHSEGFVHGDLKGDNVLIDSENRARLADFGFARVCILPGTAGASSSSETGGTPAYMAPELFEYPTSGNRSTPKKPVDVFALGTLIYEVLAGQVPFHDVDREVVKFVNSRGKEIERPSWTSIPNHPAWDMVDRCRATKPEDRPELAEVLECLTRASENPPTEWPSQPNADASSSSLGSSLCPQPSSQATPTSSSPVLSFSPIAPRVQIGAQSSLRYVAVQSLAYRDNSKFGWKVMGSGTKKQEPRPKKRKTS